MLRFALILLAGFIIVAASLVPDDAFARRGGGGRGFHGGGMRAGGFHGGGMRAGAIHGGRYAGAGRGYRLAIVLAIPSQDVPAMAGAEPRGVLPPERPRSVPMVRTGTTTTTTTAVIRTPTANGFALINMGISTSIDGGRRFTKRSQSAFVT
jgi:hypothetical protein